MSIRVVLATIALLALAGRPAFACPEDLDADGTCDALDNCPSVFNSTQSDIDGDAAGDACDDTDAVFTITALQIKADTSAASDNGYVKVKGTFVTAPPDDVFFAATGLGLRVVDDGGFNYFYGVGPAACGMVSAGKWLCLDPNGHMKVTAKAAKATPNSYRISISVRKIAVTGPFHAPAAATISQDYDIDRFSSIGTCKATMVKLTCK